MYNIEEIKLQNQYDCFYLTYMHLGRSIMDVCGRGGEGVLREAVRRFGFSRGKTMKEIHINAGYKTNLVNLFHVACDSPIDPRTRLNIIKEEEQVRIWEIYTCPSSDLWNKSGEGRIGHFYNEEMLHGLIAGYTDNKGQTNISTQLTCPRDNHCGISVYYRSANVTPEQAKHSFTGKGAAQNPSKELPEYQPFKDAVNALTLKVYFYILETARERYGLEGECAAALGLRKLASEMSRIMKGHADDTLNKCDSVFMDQNFPLNFDADKEPLWQAYGAYNAQGLFSSNFLAPLKRGLEM